MTELQPPKHNRTHIVLIVIAALVVAVLAVIGIVGLIKGPPESADPERTPRPTATVDGDPARPGDPRLPVTDDPIRYARALAEALFRWDTADGLRPTAYREALYAAAAGEGPESNGLYHDLANFLPDDNAWALLTDMQARQWIDVDQAEVPDGWAQAADQYSLAPNATAVTIDATRHRDGVWNDRPTSSQSPVAFTVFLSCPPEGCSVLRLTLPGSPLR